MPIISILLNAVSAPAVFNLVGIIAAIVAAVIAIGCLLVYVGIKVSEWNRTTKAVAKFNPQRNEAILISHEKKFEKYDKTIETINENISFIKQSLIPQGIQPSARFVAPCCPITLTETGKDILMNIDIEEDLYLHKRYIIKYLDNLSTNDTFYDIQEVCITKCVANPEELVGREIAKKVKDYAYNKGDRYYQYGEMLGILVRDLYLKEKGLMQ